MPWSASPKISVPGARNVIHRRNVHVLDGVQGDFWPSRENRKVEFLVLHLKISIDIQDIYTSRCMYYWYMDGFWIIGLMYLKTKKHPMIQITWTHSRFTNACAFVVHRYLKSKARKNTSLFIPKHSPLFCDWVIFCDWAILLFCDMKQKKVHWITMTNTLIP